MSGYDRLPPYGEKPITWRGELPFIAFMLGLWVVWPTFIWYTLT